MCPFAKNRTSRQSSTNIKVFHGCDSMHKGFLNKEDLKTAMIKLQGCKPSKFEVQQIIEKYCNADTERGLTVEEFVECMTPRMAKRDEDELIRQTFLVMDSHCRSFLTVEDLKKAFAQVAPHLSQHSIESAFREIDRDGDGRVSYKDFEFMMKYSLEDGF